MYKVTIVTVISICYENISKIRIIQTIIIIYSNLLFHIPTLYDFISIFFAEENDPIVIIESSSYIVRFGDLLTIKCYVLENENYPVQNIHWEYENNGVLTRLVNGTEGIAGSTTTIPSITIKTVTTSESGVYTCYATNDVGTGKSKPINVTVIGGKDFYKLV